MPDISAALTLLRKPIEDVYLATSVALQGKITTLRTAAKIKNLHKNLWESQKVKTIWNTDRPLSLNTFFYPVSVVRDNGEGGARTKLTTLDDFPENHNIIFGTVGQGKSILMRYLLGREMKSGERLPLLCELRNVQDTSLLEHLCDRFCSMLGIKVDIEVFLGFATAGKISFFLDGFDEIDPHKVSRLMVEIEDMSYRFPTCRILLSSRPESDCKHLTNFFTNKICPLQHSDLAGFYKKVTKDDEFTKRLVAAVAASPTKIRELVSTPLLATLLAISYRTAHKIPLDFAEFYDELFQILLVRHDGAKLGWRRQRKSKLNDREIQQLFEAFCFATRKRRSSVLDRDGANEIAGDCLAECKITTADAPTFLEDIRKITCLLVDEAKRLHFVHASVQEFFSARYIKKRPESVAKKFYEQLLGGKWRHWLEEIQFLNQIDKHRASKYFKLPDLDATLKDIFGARAAVTQELVDDYLRTLVVIQRDVVRDGKESIQYVVQPIRDTDTFHHSAIESRAYSVLFKSFVEGERGWRVKFDEDPSIKVRTYLQISQDKGGTCYARISEVVSIAITSLMRERSNLQNEIRHEERDSAFIDLN